MTQGGFEKTFIVYVCIMYILVIGDSYVAKSLFSYTFILMFFHFVNDFFFFLRNNFVNDLFIYKNVYM